MDCGLLHSQVTEFVESKQNERTKKSYRKGLGDFLEFLECKDIKNIEMNTLKQYQHYLRDLNYKPRSFTQKTWVVRSFLKHYYPDYAELDNLTFHIDKERKLESRYIRNGVFYSRLRHAKNVYGYHLERYFRFMVIVRLFIETGIAPNELVLLKLSDLDESGKIISVSKRGKIRRLPLSDALALEIKIYTGLKEVSSKYLISNSRDGTNVTTKSIERFIAEIAKDVFTARDLRHTFMCNMVLLNHSIANVDRFVGGISCATRNYLSDEVERLIKEKKPQIYKPRAADDAWIMHVINVIKSKSHPSERFVRLQDFGPHVGKSSKDTSRLLTKVFKFPSSHDSADVGFYIDNTSLVDNLHKYYRVRGRHDTWSYYNKEWLHFNEWVDNGAEPLVERKYRGILKEIPPLRARQESIVWQTAYIQRRIRNSGKGDWTVYDIDSYRRKAWFIMRSDSEQSILFAANNYPCIFFRKKVSRSKGRQSRENRKIEHRLFYNQSKKYGNIHN